MKPWVLDALAPRRPSRVSPEWGCGGVYGLHYTGETLYYTLAFDALASFHHSGATVVYDYSLLGRPPRSGGDTYNVAASVDGEIYFGGWVHAPALLRRGQVDFSNKYSHVHAYSPAERRVRLLWAEGLHHPRLWAGEVTGLLYNPARDTLLAARGDGHARLGVYELGRRGGAAERVSETRVLRGTVYMDHACFSLHHGWGGDPGVHCLELGSLQGFTLTVRDTAAASADSAPAPPYRSGDVAALATWLLVLARGGLYRLDPFGGEEPVYTRLFSFGESPYGPLRVNTVPLAGGLLAAFNAQSHATVRGTDELPQAQQRASRTPPGPTVLVHISPPVARIVAVLGTRVTSMENVGSHVLVASATCPNLERYDAVAVDHTVKTIEAYPVSSLLGSAPPPVTFRLGPWLGGGTLGGVPVHGYREALLHIHAPRGGRLVLHSYWLDTGPGGAEEERIGLETGWNRVDISSPRGPIVSLRVEAGGEWRGSIVLR